MKNTIKEVSEEVLPVMLDRENESMDDDYLQSLDESYQELNNQLKSLDKTIGKPGEVIGLIKNFGPVIKTGKGLLLLSEIQRSGKRPQSGWDLVNGTHLKVGELLS